MCRLIVIGNGFDINIGLATQYSKFYPYFIKNASDTNMIKAWIDGNEKLQAQKEALYSDYGKLKKQVKEYDVIKRNIDSILRQDREPERGKETERG